MDRTESAIAILEFPVILVTADGEIVTISRGAKSVFPALAQYQGRSINQLLASRPGRVSQWLEEARAGKAEGLVLEGEHVPSRCLLTATPLPVTDGTPLLWVVHLYITGSPGREKHEREIMLRITSVPVSTLMDETGPQEFAIPRSVPITSEILQMILQHLGGECAMLVAAADGATSLIAHAGPPPDQLAELSDFLKPESRPRPEWAGKLAEAAESGVVYALDGEAPGDGLISSIAGRLPFRSADIWVDGIGGYGAAITFFRSPADSAGRQFSTEAYNRLGRHLESADFSRRMYVAYRELQRTQERIIQTSKLAALGEMATGIAHELRQPVTAINNFLSNIFNHLESGRHEKVLEKLDEYRSRSNRNIERLTGIIDHLRTFSRQDHLHFRPTNLISLFDEMYQTFFRSDLLTLQIEVEWSFPPELPMVELDPQRIEQVILNLVFNARDAVENQPEPKIIIGAEQVGDNVRIFVKDNGPGIPEEIRDRLLEPFFSTKPVGKGTGLGLSISHGIVESHGGEIEIANNDSGGARITIVLPIKQGDTSRKPVSV